MQAVSPSYGAVCASREMEARGRASSQCLVAGPLTVARTSGKVAQAAPSCRALGSGDAPQAGSGGMQSMWQGQQQGVCVPSGVRATMVVLSGSALLCANY